MLQFSIPAGRWMGVHVRVHVSLLLLLALATGYSLVAAGGVVRGVGLWLALCAAVLVREFARALAAAYLGMPLRALFLLPTGGVMALAPRAGGGLAAAQTKKISLIGSAANFLVAALVLGFAYGVDPGVRLLAQPWISVEHVLRSVVWLQVIVGAVNLLPSAALPRAAAVRQTAPAVQGTTPTPPPQRPAGWKSRPAFGLGTAAALAMMVAGVISGLLWPVLLGLTLLLTIYLNRAAGVASVESLPVAVRDVMLTDFRPLGASTTLRDALRQTTHSLQDVFPVLRGDRLVGWISRSALLNKLRSEGDGFLQGAMSRSLQAVTPAEKVGDALRRVSAMGASEFVPVVEEGAMIGMLTPGSLERAVGQLRWTQLVTEREER